VANITSISTYTGSILCEEVTKALSGAQIGVADGALTTAYADQFKIKRSSCLPVTKTQVKCLFIYTYALQSFDAEGDNFLTEQQLIALLTKVEQLSKSCCCDE